MPTSKNVNFELEATKANQMYLLHEAELEVWISVTKKNGDPLVAQYTPKRTAAVEEQSQREAEEDTSQSTRNSQSTSGTQEQVPPEEQEEPSVHMLEMVAKAVRQVLRVRLPAGDALSDEPAVQDDPPAPAVDPKVNVKLAFTNNILHTLFSQFDLVLNSTTVNPNPEKYHVKAYAHHMLESSRWGKHTWMQAQGFYEDTPKHFYNTDANNLGFTARSRLLFAEAGNVPFNEEVQVIGKMFTSMASCHTPLPSAIKVSVRGLLNPPEVVLTGDESCDQFKYVYKVVSATYHVPVATLSQKAFEHMNERWKKIPFQFHFRRYTYRMQEVGAGTGSASVVIGLGGKNPGRFYLCFVHPNQVDHVPYKGESALEFMYNCKCCYD